MRIFKKMFTYITFICICYILWCTIEIAVLISGTVQNIVGIILYVLFIFDIWKRFFTKQNSVKYLCYRLIRDIVLLIPIYLLVLTTIYFILPTFGQPCIEGYLNYTEPAMVMASIGRLSSIIAFFMKAVKHK